MHSSEPARKKVKLVTDIDSLQSTTKSLPQPVNLVPRDLSAVPDHAVPDTCELAESSAGAVAAVKPQSFTVFVLDTQTRLFVTEVTESQPLDSVIQQLADLGCKGAEPGVVIHCRGQVQPDVSKTIAQVHITPGCTISLAGPSSTGRWEESSQMGTLFYELYDAYLAAWKVGQDPLPEAVVQKCRVAGEVQHKFLEYGNRSENCLDKLLGVLETDSIPVLSDMCVETRTSANGIPMADDLHWAACCRLVCVEGFITTAMYSTSSQQDPTLFPWLLLLLLDLTVDYCKPDASCPETSPDAGTGSILYTGTNTHARQLQKLGEVLGHMCNDWSPWSNLLPSTYYDASAKKHVLTQLLKCITSASKVLEHGFHNLKAHVTTFTSASLTPDDFCFDLELTHAWSVMIEVFLALQSKLCTFRVPPPELVHMLASYMDVTSSLTGCCEAVELFAAACVRLGIPQHSQPVDPYTGEPVPDPNRNLYLAAIPQPLRRYLSGMLPGMHAMAATPLHDIWPEADLPDVASVMPPSRFFRSPVSSAVLKVADLKPQGPLYRTVTQSGPNELQSLLPIMFRRQYLNEMFPDLSVEANYEQEPDHHQLTVPRDEFLKETCPVSLTATVTRGLSIVFTDEMGQGSGVMKEWLGMITQHIFGSKGGIFGQCSHDPATVHPLTLNDHPRATCPHRSALRLMYLAGHLSGLDLCYRCPIGIRLSRCFVKMMTGRVTHHSDYCQVDLQVCNGLQAVACATEQELRDMQLTFEPPNGQAFALSHKAEAALGDPVTVENRNKYIECLYHHFFMCTEQVTEFVTGLRALSEWDVWTEDLEEADAPLDKMLRPLAIDDFSNQLAGDLAPLCVQEWRRCTDARDFYYDQAHKDLNWFWGMVGEMGDEQRRELLCFWTSMSTVPAGGFEQLSSKLKLQASAQGLPTSHTCFYQLNLPHYTSMQDMKAAFTTALQECNGFGFG